MKKTLLFSLSLLMLASASVHSDEYRRIPLEHLTQGYETKEIFLNRGLDGKIDGIETKPCPSCSKEFYTVSSQTIFYIGSKVVSLDELTSFNGKSGAISYYPKTKELQHVRFFNFEVAQ